MHSANVHYAFDHLFCYFLICTFFHCAIANQEQFTAAVNNFSFTLLETIVNLHRTRLNNIVLSPIIAQKALASLTLGANQQTIQEIQNGIGLNENKWALADDFQNILTTLDMDPNIALTSAQFINKNYKIKALYTRFVSDYYYTNVQPLDFSDCHWAAKYIDNYIFNNTQGALTGAILDGDVTPESQLVMVNALSFAGTWQEPFDPWYTTKQTFLRPEINSLYSSSSSSSNDLPMGSLAYQIKESHAQQMNKVGNYKYGYLDNIQAYAIQIPYVDPGYSLLIVLPSLTFGVFDLTSTITQYSIDSIISQLSNQWVNVTIPKFALNLNVELTIPLKEMGFSNVFSSSANFNNIATPTGSLPPLEITDLIQKAQVSFSEGETFSEAGYPSSNPLPPAPPGTVSFNCNHPFLFYILKGNTIVLLGRILSG